MRIEPLFKPKKKGPGPAHKPETIKGKKTKKQKKQERRRNLLPCKRTALLVDDTRDKPGAS